MHLDQSSTKVLLGQRVAEGTNDARALAASVLYEMPNGLREVPVERFLGWIRGSTPSLVREYARAATIRPGSRLADLSDFQRAALIGALRFRRRIESGDPDREGQGMRTSILSG